MRSLNIWCKLIWVSYTLLNHIFSIFESKVFYVKILFIVITLMKYILLKCYDYENCQTRSYIFLHQIFYINYYILGFVDTLNYLLSKE